MYHHFKNTFLCEEIWRLSLFFQLLSIAGMTDTQTHRHTHTHTHTHTNTPKRSQKVPARFARLFCTSHKSSFTLSLIDRRQFWLVSSLFVGMLDNLQTRKKSKYAVKIHMRRPPVLPLKRRAKQAAACCNKRPHVVTGGRAFGPPVWCKTGGRELQQAASCFAFWYLFFLRKTSGFRRRLFKTRGRQFSAT